MQVATLTVDIVEELHLDMWVGPFFEVGGGSLRPKGSVQRQSHGSLLSMAVTAEAAVALVG